MDSLPATTLTAVAVIAGYVDLQQACYTWFDCTTQLISRLAEVWRQANRGRPQEDCHLIVVQQGLPEEPADMGQAEDPSELPVFLAREEARTVHQFTLRPFLVSGDASITAVHDVVTASIDFPAGLWVMLNYFIPHMETYINARRGWEDLDRFQLVHDDLEDIIEDERDAGVEIQDAWQMQFIHKVLHRQPIFWLAYNLFFPVEERISWELASMWVTPWLKRTNMEATAWPTQLRDLDVWNPDTTPSWNETVIELFADIIRRFRPTHTLNV